MVKENKERGMWLTVILLVLIVVYSLNIIDNLYSFSRQPGGLINAYALRTIILALIQLIGFILIFRWKKLGWYLYISACLISIVVGFITSSSFILGAIMYMVVILILSLMLYYFICPIWNSME
ncbi:hypothetical protein LGL08_15970 [Clostridium estertheticum]|uniref:hypothetical protein n=1 Tax=Clostridium estertheticum TaxID=238834 RepID=UPI001CF2B28D|nr:hypothetical protein [Clostridium estertheticum]MCB2307532.1 hypothetical protein [Clostridium estertheticum]MCB2345789.1 hypothetical protein [Clostridium estertheticum]MCB2351021.1 hypothetical protein [Clostridium estertheticum]WAG47808.1 hypothetical protein LL127_10350 [Clostridium estertheticum]